VGTEVAREAKRHRIGRRRAQGRLGMERAAARCGERGEDRSARWHATASHGIATPARPIAFAPPGNAA
jgi:hypothetical protein